MKNSALDYMHRLLAESLFRGHVGPKPNHAQATILATHSVHWFRQLLLRLSIQECIELAHPSSEIRDPLSGCTASWPDSDQLELIQSQDEALWDALCEGRLVLRIEGSEVAASVLPKTSPRVLH